MEGITRTRPCDLLEVKKSAIGDVSISDAIAAMQEDAGLTFDCPKCVVNGQPTGKITVKVQGGTIPSLCDICTGNLKTSVQYIADPQHYGNFIPYVAPPDNTQEPG